MKPTMLKTAFTVVLAGLSSYFGMLTQPLLVLFFAMVLDYLTGMTKAYIFSQLSSRIGVKGILKKLCYMAMVAVGAGVAPASGLLPPTTPLAALALRPAKVEWQNEDQLRFVLQQGKKRQIRRMCELVGLRVTGLKRIRMGKVKLGRLPPGQWRYLGANERF